MTRVATPATEDYLLMIARHGTAMHVDETVRHFRNALDAEELSKEARQQKQRSLTYSHDDDGSLVLKARLPAEVGSVFIKALEGRWNTYMRMKNTWRQKLFSLMAMSG